MFRYDLFLQLNIYIKGCRSLSFLQISPNGDIPEPLVCGLLLSPPLYLLPLPTGFSQFIPGKRMLHAVRELLSFLRLLLGASFLYSGNSPAGILLETVSLQYKCPRAKLTFPASAGHLGHAQDPGLINQMPPSPLWHDVSTKPGSLDFLAVCELYIYIGHEKRHLPM